MKDSLNMISQISVNTRKKFVTKYTSLSGAVSSTKNQSQVWFESSLEKDFALINEFNPEVSYYIEQPFTIEYYSHGRTRKYSPDFLVFFKGDKAPMLCEIKMKKELEAKREVLKEKFEAAELYCREENMRFIIFTEEQIRTPYLENIKFLSQYRLEHCSPPALQLMKSRVKDLGLSSPNEIFSSVHDANPSIKGKLIYAFWYLIKSNEIGCDLNSKLSLNTEIWYNYDENETEN